MSTCYLEKRIFVLDFKQKDSYGTDTSHQFRTVQLTHRTR